MKTLETEKLILEVPNVMAAWHCVQTLNKKVRGHHLHASLGRITCVCSFDHAIRYRKEVIAYLDGFYDGLKYFIPWIQEAIYCNYITANLVNLLASAKEGTKKEDFQNQDWRKLFTNDFRKGPYATLNGIRNSRSRKTKGTSKKGRKKCPRTRKSTQVHKRRSSSSRNLRRSKGISKS